MNESEKHERQKVRGKVSIVKYEENRGLGRAWFESWTPESDTERALILEDDIEVSPYFYLYLKKAWDTYGTQQADGIRNEEASVVPDLAGISLQRQTLIPTDLIPKNRHITASKNHDPYLFRLVGSIGFSPNAKYWREFAPWARSLDVQKVNVGMENLITTKWWSGYKKNSMWTPYFPFFCSGKAGLEGTTLYDNDHPRKKNGPDNKPLFTLFADVPHDKTMASHMRAAGEHRTHDGGRDFDLALKKEEISWKFPKAKELKRFGWDGQLQEDVDDRVYEVLSD